MDLYNYDVKLATLNIEVPVWINQDITAADIAAIIEGGCASGAYMPAVTYYNALQTMNDHGNDILDYVQDAMGELPDVSGESWQGMAVKYLSTAVELWAGSVEDEIIEAIEDMEDGE